MAEDFIGRPLEEEMEFRYCDICGEEGVRWLQSRKNEVGHIIVRFICNKCHDELTLDTPNVVRSIDDPDEFQKQVSQSVWTTESTPATTELGSSGQGSNWSAGFIQEALFGEDPVKWLEKKGAFEPDRVDETVEILISLGISQIDPVKKAVIKSLGFALGKNELVDNKIREALEHYANLPDEEISNLARQFLGS